MHRTHSIYHMAELNVFSGVGFSMQMLIKLHSHRVSQGVAMTTSYAVEVPFATERRPCQNCGESNRAEASLVGKIRWKRGITELRWLYVEFCIKSVPFIIRAPFFFFLGFTSKTIFQGDPEVFPSQMRHLSPLRI